MLSIISSLSIFGSKAQSGLSTDPILFAVLTSNENELANVGDINKVKEYIADKELSEKELLDFHIHMGYKTQNEMVDYIKAQNDKLLFLSKKYNFSQYSESELLEQIKNGYINKSPQQRIENDCQSVWLNCLAAVAAQSVIMHASCIPFDASIFLGIICHGAVLTYQASASSNCTSAYNRCRGAIAN